MLATVFVYRWQTVLHGGTAAPAARRRRRLSPKTVGSGKDDVAPTRGRDRVSPPSVAAAITLPLVPVADLPCDPHPSRKRSAVETGRLAHLHRDGGAPRWNRLPPSERANAVVVRERTPARRARSHVTVRRSACLAGLLGPQRLLAVRPATRTAASPIILVGYRDPQAVARSFAGLPGSWPESTTASTSTTKNRAGPIGTCARTVEPWSRLWPRAPPRPVSRAGL